MARASSDDNAIDYVLPVLWMTSYLPIIGEAKVILTQRILEETHQGAAPGAKSGGHDYLVVLRLFFVFKVY